MKILLHSFAFYPNIGGIETVSMFLAQRFSARGHTVTVVTQTPAQNSNDEQFNFSVVRNPSSLECRKLADKHDIVVSNGASVRFITPSLLANRPFVWIHQGYRLRGLDSGWADNKWAPYDFWPSFAHHKRLFGTSSAIKQMLRLLALQAAGKFVTAHVAVSKHVAKVQPLPNQIVIPNPYSSETFADTTYEQAVKELENSNATFTFLGRLVSEKGVDTLLRAFALFLASKSENDRKYSLKIIGDGAERDNLKKLAAELHISENVSWLGFRSGTDLATELSLSGICIAPSNYEEPMGVVALELMAKGKPIIVSRDGGLSESGGEACLTFSNRDPQDLSRIMMQLHDDVELQHKLIRLGLQRVRDYNPELAIDRYLELFDKLISIRRI